MNETRIIKQLESDTSVLFEEWKEIAFLLYMTEDKPLKKFLKSKYQLHETYVDFLSEKVAAQKIRMY